MVQQQFFPDVFISLLAFLDYYINLIKGSKRIVHVHLTVEKRLRYSE